MGKALLLLLLFPALGLAQGDKKQTTWSPFTFFMGTWTGTGKGQPGNSQLEREYRLILAGKFVQVSHKSVYLPQEKNRERRTRTWGS